MNFPTKNQRALAELHKLATWKDIPSAQEAGVQGMKMEAALKLVLLFHAGRPWGPEENREWIKLAAEAGCEFPKDLVTTRYLCDVIREVLGMQEEERSR